MGDSLALLFRILDLDSPYEILVRELIAQDGVDSAEILLIDERGCPTDPSIMGAVAQVSDQRTQSFTMWRCRIEIIYGFR